MAPPLLTVAEAARLARVSRVHLWRLVQRGEVEAIRVGTSSGSPIRVPTTAFLRWLYDTQPPEALPPVTETDLERFPADPAERRRAMINAIDPGRTMAGFTALMGAW